MMNNPYMLPGWSYATVPQINPMMAPQVIPQPIMPQQIQQPAAVQPAQNVQPQQPSTPVQPVVPSSVWNWKVANSYQSMLMESVPFDGTPVLFMMQNESVFYIVSMVDGKKMINGYSFAPLDNSVTEKEQPLTPEEQNEQRFSKLENSMAAIAEQLNKLVEVQNHEPDNVNTEKAIVARQPIK